MKMQLICRHVALTCCHRHTSLLCSWLVLLIPRMYFLSTMPSLGLPGGGWKLPIMGDSVLGCLDVLETTINDHHVL